MLDVFFKRLHKIGGRSPSSVSAPVGSAAQDINILLHGRERYSLEIVVSARCREGIRAVIEAKSDPGRRQHCLATLQLEHGGTSSVANVGVYIGGTMVGYFPRYLSTQYCEWLKSWKLGHARVHCHALIQREQGGPKHDPVEHRVKLDIEMPFRMTAIEI